MKQLWVDDRRPRPDDAWDRVEDYDGFVAYIETFGVPDLISFDYDLGPGRNGGDCIYWLIQKGYKAKRCTCHSTHPKGRKEVVELLQKWRDSCER